MQEPLKDLLDLRHKTGKAAGGRFQHEEHFSAVVGVISETHSHLCGRYPFDDCDKTLIDMQAKDAGSSYARSGMI